MGTEIERKFLLKDDSWRNLVKTKQRIIQGYLANTERGSVRVRLADESGYLNIKSVTLGVSRTEFEYPIPAADARQILHTLCIQPLIEKTRHLIRQDKHTWEIDVFSGENTGLEVAEIELTEVDEYFVKPDWLGEEVSDDPRYYNVRLVECPYSTWA
jgi:adenylate cyclase